MGRQWHLLLATLQKKSKQARPLTKSEPDLPTLELGAHSPSSLTVCLQCCHRSRTLSFSFSFLQEERDLLASLTSMSGAQSLSDSWTLEYTAHIHAAYLL